MQYKLRTDTEKENVSVRLSDPEDDLQSQFDIPALEPDGGDPAPETTRPQKSRTVSNREKAMAATVPGSEYWLP